MKVNEYVKIGQPVKVPWGKEMLDGVVDGVVGRGRNRRVDVRIPEKDSITRFPYYDVHMEGNDDNKKH